MRVEVRPIYEKGKPLYTAERKKRAAYTGRLKVLENRQNVLGRVVTTAKVVSVTDDVEAPVLPELSDVALLWLDDRSMRLRGFETIDQTLYAQTWDIRVL